MMRTLNPTRLAEYQDGVIALGDVHSSVAERSIAALRGFSRPFLGCLFWMPKGNNLMIRQCLILAALHWRAGRLQKADRLFRRGDALMKQSTRHGFFDEGWSYMGYCLAAYAFWNVITGSDDMPDCDMYTNIVSPEGTIPTNDTRREIGGVEPPARRTDFLHPFYSVYRLGKDTFVLVTHKTLPGRRSNLHLNFDFGHVVLYSRGRWVLNHNWYEGWPAKRAGDGKRVAAQNVILDGWRTREPWWRINPFNQAKVERIGHNKLILTYRPGVTRTIEVSTGTLRIEDRGGECSVYNFSPDAQEFFLRGTRQELEVTKDNHRYFLGGPTRKAVFRC